MPFVFKVKYESTLRRMIVKEAKDGTPALTFKDLEAKIHNMFQIPIDNRLVMTYEDQDKETVTMGGDLDLQDACIVQRIDPLRMEVKVQKTKPDGVEHQQVIQTKSLQSSSVVQSHAVKTLPDCSKTAALPDQLLSNDVDCSLKARYLNRQSTALALKPPHPAKVPARKRCCPGHKHGSCFAFNKGNRQSSKKLDARFVQHLSFPDATEVSVGTHFTKYWRLRNTGSLPWPSATQLVCVGGNVLGSQKPSKLKIPYSGLLSGEEIDASVELVAPGRPGRFVSYWRLVAPTGQKFGRRIWVVIQATSKPQGPHQLPEAGESLVEQSHKKFGRMEEPRQLVQSRGNDIKPSCVQSHKLARNVEEHRQLSRSSGSDPESPAVITIHHGFDGAVPNLDSPLLSTMDVKAPMPPLRSLNTDGHETMGDLVLHSPCPMRTDALLSTMSGKVPMPQPRSPHKDGHETMGDPLCPMHMDAEHATDSNLVKSGVGAFSLVEKPDVNIVQCGNLTMEPPSPPSRLLAGPLSLESSHSEKDPGLVKQREFLEVVEDHELSDCQEDIILGVLNSMGFTQRSLNLELLHKNKDMQGTVNNLVVASEWDHILDELEELGFYDADMNR